MECFKGIFKHLPTRRLPRGPNSKQLDEDEREIATSTGLTFKLKLLAVRDVAGGEMLQDSQIFSGRETQRGPAKTKKGEKGTGMVSVTVAPTRIHITKEKPWALLYDHPIEAVSLVTSCQSNPRVVVYAVKDTDITSGETSYKYLYLCTLKKQRKMNGERVCSAIKYAQTFWEEEYPKVIHSRVEELKKTVPPLKDFSETLAECHMIGPRDLQVNPTRQPDNDSEDDMRLLAKNLVASAISRATDRYLRELETPKKDVITTPVQSEEISDHVGIPYSIMVTEELSGMAVDQSSCPVQLDFLSKVPSITALSVSSV